MVIEEIINELDKFITKYKERKDGAEKGASLRNNIKQALTEKGIQGADTLDDSAIVERIKTLPSRGNTTVEGTQGNNSINESFAQQVVRVLKENHIPFLNSKEDNLEEFKKYMNLKQEQIVDVTKFIKATVKGGSVHVIVTPKTNQAVKVKYTENGQQREEIVKSKKQFTNITEFKYQPCDYYGVIGAIAENSLHLDFFKKQLNKDNIKFEFEEQIGDSYSVKSIVDNNDYDIMDATITGVYIAPLSEEIENRFKGGTLYSGYEDLLSTLQYNGVVKILILDGEYGYKVFEFGSFRNNPFKNKPKYIVLKGSTNIQNVINLDLDVSYPAEYEDINSETQDKLHRTKTAIYRWDSTENKYMFESVDTLEDWLKEHPIDTL